MSNPVRGEVSATIGDVEVTLVADMNRLAAVSRETDRPTFRDLHARLAGGEIDTILSALRNFVVKGRRGTEDLDYSKTMTAIGPQIDIATSLSLGSQMTELLAALLSSKAGKTESPLGNATGAQSQ